MSFLYAICKERNRLIFVCSLCSHIEQVDGFERDKGNPRTQAARAMLNHARRAHGREAIVAAIPQDHGLTSNFG